MAPQRGGQPGELGRRVMGHGHDREHLAPGIRCTRGRATGPAPRRRPCAPRWRRSAREPSPARRDRARPPARDRPARRPAPPRPRQRSPADTGVRRTRRRSQRARRQPGRPPDARPRAPRARRYRTARPRRNEAGSSRAPGRRGGRRSPPTNSTAPARSVSEARDRKRRTSARPASSRGAPTNRNRTSGSERRAIATASSARFGRFQAASAPSTSTSGGDAGRTTASNRVTSTPGETTTSRSPSRPPGSRSAATVCEGAVTTIAPRAAARTPSPITRPGRRSLCWKANRPGLARKPPGQRGAHPPSDHQVGRQVARKPPQLQSMGYEPPERQRALGRRSAQLETALGQREHSQPGRTCGGGQRPLGAGQRTLARQAARELHQQPLRPSEGARVAGEQDHAMEAKGP